MKRPFDDYLRELHAKEYLGLDDYMEDDFERWLAEKDGNEIIDLANTAMLERAAKVMGSITSKKKARAARLNGKKGGRPSKEL